MKKLALVLCALCWVACGKTGTKAPTLEQIAWQECRDTSISRLNTGGSSTSRMNEGTVKEFTSEGKDRYFIRGNVKIKVRGEQVTATGSFDPACLLKKTSDRSFSVEVVRANNLVFDQ